MSIYIDKSVIKNSLIKQEYVVEGVYDETLFNTEIEEYLLAADNKYLGIIKERGLTVADVPTFADGMHQDAIDLLKYYVYYNFFDDNSAMIVSTVGATNPNKSNAQHFEEHFNNMLDGLTNNDILNSDPVDEDSFTGIAIDRVGF